MMKEFRIVSMWIEAQAWEEEAGVDIVRVVSCCIVLAQVE